MLGTTVLAREDYIYVFTDPEVMKVCLPPLHRTIAADISKDIYLICPYGVIAVESVMEPHKLTEKNQYNAGKLLDLSISECLDLWGPVQDYRLACLQATKDEPVSRSWS